jgi:hypothetical protein
MHRRVATSALSLLVASALVLAPMRGAMAATDDATITVWTKDGSMFRGEVVERVPNDHVTIKLATGETKRVEWKDLDHDSLGDRPAIAPAATRPRHERRAELRVHFEADHANAVLEREIGSTSSDGGGQTRIVFGTVCQAPCDDVLPAGPGYRVSGPGLRPSDSFSLSGRDDVVIKARNGSASAYSFGGGLMMWSLLPLAIGGSLAFLTPKDTADYDYSGLRRSGYVVLGIGVTMVAVGITLLVVNRSSVEVNGASVASRNPGHGSAFALTPTGFVF